MLYHLLLIHSPVDENLGSFHFLALVNHVAVNFPCASFWLGTVFISDVSLGAGLWGHTVILCLAFWNCQNCFSKVTGFDVF